MTSFSEKITHSIATNHQEILFSWVEKVPALL